VGVQRQYTGTAGKVENAHVAVYLAYATAAGHGVIDRELYLPQGWIDDPARCHAAGVPGQVGFATKPELARLMLQRALDAEVPAGWVTAEEVYGGSPTLRRSLRTGELAYHVCAGPTGLPAIRRTGCAGRGGDAGSRPALAPASTDGKPPSNHEGHDPVGVLVLQ
jgi:DDE superfamily endonuclease